MLFRVLGRTGAPSPPILFITSPSKIACALWASTQWRAKAGDKPGLLGVENQTSNSEGVRGNTCKGDLTLRVCSGMVLGRTKTSVLCLFTVSFITFYSGQC